MLGALKAQDPGERARKSLLIGTKLSGWSAYRTARTVCFFVALPTEVDTVPMIERALKEGKRVLVPRVDHLENKELKLYEIRDLQTDLSPGTMGIREPDPARSREAKASEADCILVPGLAFDRNGRRLGRGAAFYDKFLSSLRPDLPKAGLAFSFQVFPEIPYESHDRTVDIVITEV